MKYTSVDQHDYNAFRINLNIVIPTKNDSVGILCLQLLTEVKH